MLPFLRRKSGTARVLVIGLDCADPGLVFDRFHADLPVLASLMRRGTWGKLRSSTPCITVPAWASMMSGRDPGVLGIYGFRNRAAYNYDDFAVADSQSLSVPRVWDYVSQAGRDNLIQSVPQTYPVKPLRGHLTSCFLTPDSSSAFAYPALFKQEVMQRIPHYAFDVRNFRTPDKADLLQRIIDFTEQQYALFEWALKNKPWHFAMHVNMGVDRIHHGFWRYHDSEHRLHEPGSVFQTAIRDYYKLVDHYLGRILESVPDDVTTLVVSDHGVKRMDGAVCINEWLWQEGWLVLKEAPTPGQISRLDLKNVDWSRTRAWSTGGYYGRIFLNVAGREPQGLIPAADYQRVRAELSARLQALTGPDNQSISADVFFPEEIYQSVNGFAPDMLVYFGDLHWRAVGSLAYGQAYTFDNDTGPDDANHSEDGLFILSDAGSSGLGEVSGHQLMDIAPTLLSRMGLSVPVSMQGKIIAVR